ncbi:MAG: septum formation initiator family protein [Melioribacteraceae bacterium]|nr:septum formation initiator family protein [Melioribacteraceae bacterium]MCF8356439.1 septum formation initiator family protein [Melioribacteraceae bacterium]MCF8394868.1 septum formation initiator family protein [Melioribacteraceae bacterium]MCF8420596.1 septum formation initiator family protein [Melioribacteraceae bacterium]
MKTTGKGIRRFIYFLIFLAVASFLFFNEYGILKYLRLSNQLSELQNSIEAAEAEMITLDKEIGLLKSELHKIEEVAREKYHMLSEDEIAIKIEEQ